MTKQIVLGIADAYVSMIQLECDMQLHTGSDVRCSLPAMFILRVTQLEGDVKEYHYCEHHGNVLVTCYKDINDG